MNGPLKSTSSRPARLKRSGWLILALALGLAACDQPAATPQPPRLAEALVLYNWAEYMPQSVLDAFTAEYGVKVNTVVYETQEEAVDHIRAGEVYDVVVMGNEFIPTLAADGLLAEINYSNVSNFKNISANFRDLAYDPGNRHSVPFHWGTSGLVVRSDLIDQPVSRWRDLWDERYAGKVAVWGIPRDLIGIALKSLGYSTNSEDPYALEAALDRLVALKSRVQFIDLESASVTPYLESGNVVVAVGWAYDALTGREANPAISYVLPEEGALLWGDNFVIPANSRNRYTAELFLNFLLRPKISAQIVNESYYPVPNAAAQPLIDPHILADPIVYPWNSDLRNAEVMLPLSDSGEKLYADIWQRFLAAGE
jgi:spermidine/putrescine transport system substrate-binding protein